MRRSSGWLSQHEPVLLERPTRGAIARVRPSDWRWVPRGRVDVTLGMALPSERMEAATRRSVQAAMLRLAAAVLCFGVVHLGVLWVEVAVVSFVPMGSPGGR